MAHIKKRPDRPKPYRVRYVDPSGRERSKSFAKKSDAEKFVIGTEADKLEGRWVDPNKGKMTFADWQARTWATTTNLRPSTRARDESYTRNHVLPRFGAMPLARITQLDVRAWVSELVAAGLAPATVVRCYQILARTMAAAVDGEMIALSPCRNIPLPRVERHEMRFMVPDEVAALADAMDERYRAFVLLGAYGGLRLGEMFALRRRRFDQLRARVEVAETLADVRGHLSFGPPKTNAANRSVPLPRPVADALAEHLGRFGREDSELVFCAPEGGPCRATLFRRRFWAPAVAAAGLSQPLPRIHDLRHTAVALWIAAGASPKEIARRAGHTSVAVVLDRYGHVMPDDEARVTANLERHFAAKTV